MSLPHRADFQILRLDVPVGEADRHYRAFWRLREGTFRVHVWTLDEWGRIPEGERPPDTRPLDGGLMTVRPVADGDPPGH